MNDKAVSSGGTQGRSPERSSALARLHAVVHGHVQGVCFRSYTRHRALDLNLRGFVRNQADGTVEVVAEGEKDTLVKLQAWLRRGPPQAWVQQVDLWWESPTGEFWDFEVRY